MKNSCEVNKIFVYNYTEIRKFIKKIIKIDWNLEWQSLLRILFKKKTERERDILKMYV